MTGLGCQFEFAEQVSRTKRQGYLNCFFDSSGSELKSPLMSASFFFFDHFFNRVSNSIAFHGASNI